MNATRHPLMTFFALSLFVSACADRNAGSMPVKAASAPSASSAVVTDNWLGTWTGPEGTSLRLVGGQGQYEVTIQNLDGPRTFRGKAVGDRIEFERDGAKEFIHATNGAATGMKWLSEKSNCLTVRAGEGYCQD